MTEYIYDCGVEPTISAISGRATIHPIQREIIVRCKDCRYFREKHGLCAGFGYEWNGELVQVEPEGFCAWAEREQR